MATGKRTGSAAADTSEDRAVFRAFLEDPRGRGVLDLGCAAPDIARWTLDRGAASYLGLAAGDADLEAARDALTGTAGEVRRQNPDRWSGHDAGSFDMVMSWMTVHRVSNIARLLETVHHHLVPGGPLVFAVPHPIVTAGIAAPGGNGSPGGDWVRGYFAEGERFHRGGGEDSSGAAIRHRTLGGYLNELRLCGFRLRELAETLPASDQPGTAGMDVPACAVFLCERAR